MQLKKSDYDYLPKDTPSRAWVVVQLFLAFVDLILSMLGRQSDGRQN